MATATFRVWRGNAQGGEFRDYSIEISEGMVVLDAIHHIQAEEAGDLAVRWNFSSAEPRRARTLIRFSTSCKI